jgi:hypothetical protein
MPACLPAALVVCQVTKSTEVARLDQRLLLLSVNHKGIILQVNPGEKRAARTPILLGTFVCFCRLSVHAWLSASMGAPWHNCR